MLYLIMRFMARALLFTSVVTGMWLHASVAVAQVPTAPTEGGFILSSPTCSTHDKTGAPATSFAAADEIIVRGAAFPAEAYILLTFRQDAVTAELGRFRANAAGEFTSEPTQMRLPSGTTGGPASISASSDGPSATCVIQMTAPLPVTRSTSPEPEPAGDDPNVLFAIWATVLALGGGALTFLGYRTWQERRLAGAMASAGGKPRKRRKGYQAPPRLDADWLSERESSRPSRSAPE